MIQLYKPFQLTLTKEGLRHLGLSMVSSSTCNALKGVVHSYLQISAERPTPYPVMPDGTQAIFISPEGSTIGGALTRSCDIQILQPGEYFGIRFYPGALRNFFELDLSEITDQFVDDHHYLPCRDFRSLHEMIYQCQDFCDRADVCERWLLRHYESQPIPQFEHAMSVIHKACGDIKVSQLAAMVGWSDRHLNRMFQRYTGLNTKTFSQTVRIQSACSQLYSNSRNSLRVALDLGFFDQSHLIKDFRKRLLESPNALFDRFMSDFYNS